MRRLVGLILPVTLVVALAACGGSSDDSKSSTTGKPSSSSEIEKLIKKGSEAKAKVTYKTTDGTTVTIAQDPPKRALVQGDSAIYEDGDEGAVICSKFGATDVSCIRVERLGGLATFAGAGGLGTVAQVLQQKNLPGVSPLGDRTIAGRQAACARYSLPLFGSGAVESCVDKKTGVMLSLKTSNSAGANVNIEATKVEEPKSSDFKPPATPKDLKEFLPTSTT